MIALEQIGAPAFLLGVCDDRKFRFLEVNAAYTARTGLGSNDVSGRTPYDIHDPLTAAWLSEFFQDAVSERRTVKYDIQVSSLLGDVWWRTALTPVVGADGTVGTLLGICQDVTTEKRLEADIVARNQHLDLAIRMLKGATWHFDVHADRYDVSSNIALLLGEEQPRNVSWKEWAERVLTDDRDIASCDALLEAGAGEQSVEFRFFDNDGRIRWARCQRIVTTDAAAYPIVCGVVIDITAERQRAAALEFEATRDSLTGLLNRRGLKRALPTPLPPGSALVMIDVDGLKLINDGHGHAKGDAALVAIAQGLAAAIGADATTARLGGDEFLAVVPAADLAEARRIRRRVDDALAFSVDGSGKSLRVSASVGLAWTDHPLDVASLLEVADDDLYCRKRARKAAARASVQESHDRQDRAAA